MASAVYETIEADREKRPGEKRPLVLVVDTPGNAPGKVEEIFGMNKATGAYQLALAEARKCGHAVVAIVIGRAHQRRFSLPMACRPTAFSLCRKNMAL